MSKKKSDGDFVKKKRAEFLRQGLSKAEAEKRLEKYGTNTIEKGGEIRVYSILLSQFKSPLIYILVIAAAITFVLGDFVDTAVIGLAVVVNTILGFYQEYKAQRALVALRSLLSPKATVIRDGERVKIEASLVVPGDVCLVGLGERISADGVVVQANDLSLSEAILTGESMPVHKKEMKIMSYGLGGKSSGGDDEGMVVDKIVNQWEKIEREKKIFAGTIVSSGDAVFVATVTGENTEVGKIAHTLKETEEEATPLQKRIGRFSNQLAVIVGVIAVVIFTVGILVPTDELQTSKEKFETMFTTSVAIAVAAIPEGLAVSLTAILAIGMQRILKKKALVRKLVAAETLGSVTVICADKTGTLTEGVMKVTKSDFVDEEVGVRTAILANSQRDPLELAIWEWVRESKRHSPESLIEGNERLYSIPFSPRNKYSAKLYEDGVYVIGAPEVVLSFCDLAASQKIRWQKKFDEYGIQGLRIVGFAKRERIKGEMRLSRKSVERRLTWVGVLVYEDPIRRGVAEALKEAQNAGINVKVITGDYRATAEGVLERLGLLTKKAKLKASRPLVIEGKELEGLSVDELRKRVGEVVLFARTDPIQKLKIVEALKTNGEVVAMTGDGVNDAPALKKSDIGIVVSEATDVAKGTADMVLMDNNFSTIVAAVEEGRGIFENLRKVILYLLSDSFSEVILVLGSIMLRIPLPLTAAQILWINLITDGFPSLALTVEPKDNDLMRQKPRDSREPLLDREIKVLILLISVVTGLVTLAAFFWFWKLYDDVSAARTVVFVMLGVDSLLYVFSARSLSRPIWKTNIFSNKWLLVAVLGGFGFQLLALYLPFLQKILNTRPLMAFEWLIVLGMGVLVIGLIEFVKWWFLQRKRVNL